MTRTTFPTTFTTTTRYVTRRRRSNPIESARRHNNKNSKYALFPRNKRRRHIPALFSCFLFRLLRRGHKPTPLPGVGLALERCRGRFFFCSYSLDGLHPTSYSVVPATNTRVERRLLQRMRRPCLCFVCVRVHVCVCVQKT